MIDYPNFNEQDCIAINQFIDSILDEHRLARAIFNYVVARVKDENTDKSLLLANPIRNKQVKKTNIMDLYSKKVIERAPWGAKAWAVDKNGDAFYYKVTPKIKKDIWVWGVNAVVGFDAAYHGELSSIPWEETLIVFNSKTE